LRTTLPTAQLDDELFLYGNLYIITRWQGYDSAFETIHVGFQPRLNRAGPVAGKIIPN
jgi:hypothetical protein